MWDLFRLNFKHLINDPTGKYIKGVKREFLGLV